MEIPSSAYSSSINRRVELQMPLDSRDDEVAKLREGDYLFEKIVLAMNLEPEHLESGLGYMYTHWSAGLSGAGNGPTRLSASQIGYQIHLRSLVGSVRAWIETRKRACTACHWPK